MRILTNLFPDAKKTALTMSYDDGCDFDKRLVEIFNKNGIKGTFHLNSVHMSKPGNGRVQLDEVKELYKDEEINDIDGVKIDFADKWVHLRKSNTEPIIRVYSEAATPEAAEEIGRQIMKVIEDLAK